jgi:hypothetical protein
VKDGHGRIPARPAAARTPSRTGARAGDTSDNATGGTSTGDATTGGTGADPAAASAVAHRGLAAIGVSIALIVVTGLLGPSPTEPALPGRRPGVPPYFVHTHASPWLVCALMLAFMLIGAWGTHLTLKAVAAGWRPRLRRLVGAGIAGSLAVVLVPPMGSADIVQYAAYGRIAAHYHQDVYSVTPAEISQRFGDPVTSAVGQSWQDTPSVYGPIATWLQEFASWIGGDSVHVTVWVLQLINAAAFVLAGVLAIRLAGADPAARTRAVLLGLANPVLVWAVVGGAHNDAQAAVFGVAALLVLRRSPLAAGAALGLAGSVKLSLGLYGIALLWALRRSRRGMAELCLGAAVVMIALYLTTSRYVFDQVLTASKYMSTGTPGKLIYQPFMLMFSDPASRRFTSAVVWIAALVLVAMVMQVMPAVRTRRADPHPGWHVRRGLPAIADDQVSADAVRATVAITLVWLLTAMYSLPWYDVVTWLPLAGLAASRLDRLLLARTTVMAAAYVPGLVQPLPPVLGFVAGHLRSTVAPVLELAVIVLLVCWAIRRGAKGPRGMWRALRAGRWRALYPPVRIAPTAYHD